jgi:4-hydroxy-3-polyprenylbenzoate decarboxylase
MRFKDLREFITFLESKGELRRISAQVDPELEITEIADRVISSGGPALLFENVKGHSAPVLINIYGTHQRVAWALGVESVDEITNRVREILGIAKAPPKGIMDKLRVAGKLMSVARSVPKVTGSGPCQEVVLTGDDVDIGLLPVIKCWPLDAGRYITLPLVITRDPATGRRNVGIYRVQVHDSKTLGLHWQSHKHGAHHFREGERQKQDRLEVALAIGADPATMYSGSLPLPPDMDEFGVAGVIRGEPVEMVRCKTVDLEVPAQAEYVIEGYTVPGETRPEGPFGDHTGYYSLTEEYPAMHVTAITHRRNPIYATTFVGRPPKEDYFMGHASGRIMLPALQMTLPEVTDIAMPAEGIFQNLVIVSMKKEFPGHARKVMHALWGLGLLMLTKVIVVVDDNVNVHDASEVAWRVLVNIDPARDFVFADGPADDLDHAASRPRFAGKVGIDATVKLPGEGHYREWPPEIVMSDDIKRLVDKRWHEYGI